ncbi:DUF4244 domain-containing protein [Streptomyces sp. PmtG]
MGVVMRGRERGRGHGQGRGQAQGLNQGQSQGQGRRRTWTARRMCRLREGANDVGMATSEYAMGLIAAVGFAGLLYKVVTSGPVRAELQALVERALHVPF